MGILLKYQEGGKVEEPKQGAYDYMLDSVVTKKGGKKEDYEQMMDQIGYHESKYIVKDKEGKKHYKRMDYAAKQVGGGPGRGVFMFEEGENAGGSTAVRRTKSYLEENELRVPEWLEEASKERSIDVSKLDKYQQRMLFMGNYMQHPKADMGKVVSGDQSVTEFWGTYHQTKNDPEKLKNFDDDLDQWEEDTIVERSLATDPLNQYKRGGGLLRKY